MEGEKRYESISPPYILISPDGQWFISDFATSSQGINAKIIKVNDPANFFSIQVSNYFDIFSADWSLDGKKISLGLSHQRSDRPGCFPTDVVIYRYEKGKWVGPIIYPSSTRIPTKDCLSSSWSEDGESIFIFPRVPNKDGNIPIEKINKLGQLQNDYLIKTDIPDRIDNYDSTFSHLVINNLGDDIFIKYYHEYYPEFSNDYYYFSSIEPDKVEHLFHFDGFCDLIGKDQNGKVYFSRIPSRDLDRSIFVTYDLPTKKIIANSTVDMRIAPPQIAVSILHFPVHNRFVLESMRKIYLLDIQNMKLTNMGDIYTVVGWNTKLKGYLLLKENENEELYLSLLKP